MQCHRFIVESGDIYLAHRLDCPHTDNAKAAGLWVLRLPMIRPLTLNARGSHWAVAYRAKQRIKSDTHQLAKAQRIPQLQRARVELRYCPPDQRRRDVDNLVATLKPAVDGLRAAHVLIDDDPTHAELAMPAIETPRGDHKPLLYLIVTDLGEA